MVDLRSAHPKLFLDNPHINILHSLSAATSVSWEETYKRACALLLSFEQIMPQKEFQQLIVTVSLEAIDQAPQE